MNNVHYLLIGLALVFVIIACVVRPFVFWPALIALLLIAIELFSRVSKAVVIGGLVLLLGAAAVQAQTDTNTIAATNAPAATNSMWQDVTKLGSDAWSALSAVDFGQGIGVSPFGLYVGGNIGGGLAVESISTNTPVHLGFAVAGISEKQPNGKRAVDWYEGALTIALSGTQQVPILGSVTVEAITGPAFNLNSGTPYSQSFAHFQKNWVLGRNIELGAGGGPGYLSKYPDKIAYEANVTLNWRF